MSEYMARKGLTFKRYKDGLLKDQIIPNSQENVRLAVAKLGVSLQWDALKETALVNSEPVTDLLIDDLWLRVDAVHKFRPGKEFFRTVVMNEAQAHRFHPVLDYLNAQKWDGTARLDTWLIDFFGAPDTPYVRAVSAIVLIAAVRRVRKPGVKFDELPVLESGQGKGKSSGLRVLAGNDEWFTDNLALNWTSKLMIEQTAGFWIVEVPELEGLRRADWDKLKALLSRQEDVARLSYDRFPQRRPRQFVAVGTTNGHEYLGDQTGNRRFWPIRLNDEPVDLDGLKAARDQLWAEAVQREYQGESIRLPRELWLDAGDQQRDRTKRDPWAEVLEDALGDFERGRITAEDVYQLVGLADVERRTTGDGTRIRVIMENMGWRRPGDNGRMEVGGKRVAGWFKGEPVQGAPLPLIAPRKQGDTSAPDWANLGGDRVEVRGDLRLAAIH